MSAYKEDSTRLIRKSSLKDVVLGLGIWDFKELMLLLLTSDKVKLIAELPENRFSFCGRGED